MPLVSVPGLPPLLIHGGGSTIEWNGALRTIRATLPFLIRHLDDEGQYLAVQHAGFSRSEVM